MRSVFALTGILLLGVIPGLAGAGTPTGTTPEPGTLELLALGGVVALVIGIRNWRRDKR